MSMRAADFQSYNGPGDRDLANGMLDTYQPVSRIGEVVMNAFVDSYEFAALEDTISVADMTGDTSKQGNENKPHFYAWATVQPGVITLARKKKTAVFRQYVASETAVPVIACATCLKKSDEENYFFAGIARSKSVRTPDDGMGASVDEFFTVSIGGMATVLNTAPTEIYPGDLVEWCLVNTATASQRAQSAPRRVAIQVASVSSPKIIGRALSFAKKGETFDVSATSLHSRVHKSQSEAKHFSSFSFADSDQAVNFVATFNYAFTLHG